ncbi:MAG: NADH-quinone oxidoreductase subunit H [Candidatus Omnitrophica bacterium]|nr:NADH-quinone oxidoreductase subunit H [Candidatus Omnitrophota bacterium]
MEIVKSIFNYLVFPGLIFSVFAGLMACWIDRKVSARLQWRVGPPWHQSITDIIKLLGKETIFPQGGKFTFLLAPFLGFLSASLVAAILGWSILNPDKSFSSDLIVVLYLLLVPAVAVILGASASRNPLASVGASREMKMVLAYELPFILAVIAMIIKSSGAIQLGKIINHQLFFGSNILSFSGLLAFLSIIFCIQAKLGLVPFDASEAEQEIMGGALIEYSGLGLALFKLTKAVMLYTMPLFVIILFMGRDLSPLFMILKFVGILVIFILIKNTNPRLRIDQAMRFFWRVPTLLSAVAVVLNLKEK